ncbi:MAG TPA: tetratricopeptide repeat protein [Candidatus Limnocylindria bacterium]|jgi:tetratricopeptide (TPR) repeat protein
MTTLRLPISSPRHRVARLVGVGLAVLVVLLASRLPLPGSPVAPAAAPAVEPEPLAPAPQLDARGSLGLLPPAERVDFWEKRVAAGGSYLDLINLADAYLDRSRATGDLDDLTRAATALDSAAETAPYPPQVDVRRAQVAFALHDFAGALQRADDVLRDDPNNLAALGVAADARLETGDVDGARERYEQLARLAPSPAAWSRLGRLAFLTGDPDAAIRLVARAEDESRAAGAPDAEAFYALQLGDLRRATGDLDGAAAAYDRALAVQPDYVPAMAGLAAVHHVAGRDPEATQLLEAATARLPQPELVAALGDLYALAGRQRDADAQYRLVDGIAQLSAANGSVYDRQLTLFAADHGRDLAAAVRRAGAELAVRGDVYGHDALAWALFNAGQLDEAAAEATAAMALGTPDPRIAYHAGLIAAARGERDVALPLLRLAVRGGAMLPPLQLERARAELASLEAAA